MGATLTAESLLVLRLVWSAGLLLAGFAVWRPAAFRLARGAWLGTFALGAAQAVLQYAYYRAVTATNIGTAVFLEYLAPIAVVVVSWLRGRLPLERWSLLATGSALAGSALLVVGGDGGGLQLSRTALGFGLLAAGMLAAQNLLIEALLPRADRLSLFLWSTVAAATVAMPLGDSGALLRTDWLAGRPLFAVSYMVVLATLVPMLLLMFAIRRLGAARAGLVVTLEPVVAALAAAAFLGETMGAGQWVGGLCILAAVVLMQRAPEPREAR